MAKNNFMLYSWTRREKEDFVQQQDIIEQFSRDAVNISREDRRTSRKENNCLQVFFSFLLVFSMVACIIIIHLNANGCMIAWCSFYALAREKDSVYKIYLLYESLGEMNMNKREKIKFL